MSDRTWMGRLKVTMVCAAALAAACHSDGVTDPTTQPPAAERVAFVVQEGGHPALYVQNGDGSGRTRIHFTGAQEMPGNPDVLPPVRDEYIVALGPLAWSPDGQKLAVVVTLAYDQSEVVVMNADGSDARVASFNTQIILTAPDWSADGTKLAYGMSTLPRAEGVQLFVTDLAANSWRQVTSGPAVGSAGTDVRWGSDGATLYLWRTIAQTPEHQWVSRISSVDAATGVARVLADSVAGMVQDVARSGAWTLVLRVISQPSGQDWVRELVRRPLAGDGPELRLVTGNFWWARATADDRGATVVVDEDPSSGTDSFAAWALPIDGGKSTAIPGLDKNAYMLDVHYR